MWKTSAKGLAAGIASILIVMIILFSRVRNYSEKEIFFFYWIIHHLIHFFVGTGLFFLFHRKNIFKKFPFTGSGYFIYWAGYFVLYGLYDTVMYFGEYDIYILFILPLLRIFLLVSFIFSMTCFFSKKNGAVKILYMFIAPGATLISAAVSYFYYINRLETASAFFILIIILIISCLFYFHKTSEKSGRRIYDGLRGFT